MAPKKRPTPASSPAPAPAGASAVPSAPAASASQRLSTKAAAVRRSKKEPEPEPKIQPRPQPQPGRQQGFGAALASWVADHTRPIGRCVALAVLLGVACAVSQLSLSPVYGALPAARFHNQLVIAGCFVGWAGNLALWANLRRLRPPTLLPLLAAYAPVAHFALGRASQLLTARWGPLVTEAVALFPLLVVTASCLATALDDVDFGPIPALVADSLPGIVSWSVMALARSAAAAHLAAAAGRTLLQTRLVLHLLLAACHAALAPSRLLLWAVPALLHTALLNPHLALPHATAALRADLLHHHRVLLLDRHESRTGYLSVLESVEDGFRVMRCDHSLLGGQWTRRPPHADARGPARTDGTVIVHEPIYAVFVMLEAVRLVELPNPVADGDADALVIGLGVGTTPSALIAHGIRTTIVEIDPVVYEFAQAYFHLPSNHTAVIADAVSYTADLAATVANGPNPDHGLFHYIVHDVFTGGAEPTSLFTLEFLQGLSTLLTPNGVIAINYAGDLTLPQPSIVVHTIRQVFPQCSVFRDTEREAATQPNEPEFVNMVVFCTKSRAPGPLTFRPATPADLLGSLIREKYLEPRFELTDAAFRPGTNTTVLRRNRTAHLDQWQDQSALRHWEIIRTVLPAPVWEKW